MTQRDSALGQPLPRQHVVARLIRPQTRTARLARAILAVFFVSIGAYSLKASLKSLQSPFLEHKDMLQEYLFARAWLDGADPYAPVQSLADRYLDAPPSDLFTHPSAHPPPASVLFLPIGLLSYKTAATLWVGFEVACVIGSVYLLARASGKRLSPIATVATALALSVWYPFLREYVLGQTMAFELLLLAASWLALRSDRPTSGGLLLGCALLLKPVAWPLIVLLVIRRNWRGVAWSVGTVGAGYMISMMLLGLDPVVRYLTGVLPTISTVYRTFTVNVSVWTLGWRAFVGGVSTPVGGVDTLPLVAYPEAAPPISASIAALTLTGAFLVARKQSLDAQIGTLPCASILLSPVCWPHYLLLTMVAIVVIVRSLAQNGWPVRLTNLAFGTAILLIIPDSSWTLMAVLTAGYDPADLHDVLPFTSALITLGPLLTILLLMLVLARVSAAIPTPSEHSA